MEMDITSRKLFCSIPNRMCSNLFIKLLVLFLLDTFLSFVFPHNIDSRVVSMLVINSPNVAGLIPSSSSLSKWNLWWYIEFPVWPINFYLSTHHGPPRICLPGSFAPFAKILSISIYPPFRGGVQAGEKP